MDAKLRTFEIVDGNFGSVLRGDFVITVPLANNGKTWDCSHTTEGCDAGFAQIVGGAFAMAISKGDHVEDVADQLSALGLRMVLWSSQSKECGEPLSELERRVRDSISGVKDVTIQTTVAVSGAWGTWTILADVIPEFDDAAVQELLATVRGKYLEYKGGK